MELTYLGFILLSAMAHSFYNFLIHKSGGNRLFLLLMFVVAAIAATIVYISNYEPFVLNFKIAAIIYAASLFYILYQVFVSKSYELGEISRLYPLSVLSPVLVPVWAVLFLHERISMGLIIGIILSTAGAMIMKQKSLRNMVFSDLFTKRNLYAGAGYALTASLMYSFGSVLDKSSVGLFNLIPYLWILLSSMTLNLLIYTILFERKVFADITHINYTRLTLAGITAYISFFTFRAALQHVPVSVAVPIRTSSIIFALLLGSILLHEKITAIKLIGISTIIIGIVIIQIST